MFAVTNIASSRDRRSGRCVKHSSERDEGLIVAMYNLYLYMIIASMIGMPISF